METVDLPFFTVIEGVYHVLDDCPVGRRIPPELRQVGTGGRELCPACADFNYAKRTETADLAGRVALITGGRVKIGYQAGIKMLRAGRLASREVRTHRLDRGW